jgi:hypothetical protein
MPCIENIGILVPYIQVEIETLHLIDKMKFMEKFGDVKKIVKCGWVCKVKNTSFDYERWILDIRQTIGNNKLVPEKICLHELIRCGSDIEYSSDKNVCFESKVIVHTKERRWE